MYEWIAVSWRRPALTSRSIVAPVRPVVKLALRSFGTADTSV